jgi:peptidoglycan hydrolase-like protein with peptidoglycan-binding domain
MKNLTLSIFMASVMGMFAVGQTFAEVQQENEQPIDGMQTEVRQSSEVIGERQQLPVEMTSEQVREVQQSLQKQGVDPGPIDGIMGARTRKGLREFQQEKGLAATGQINMQTIEALHLEVGEFMGVAPVFEIDQEKQIEHEGALQIEG